VAHVDGEEQPVGGEQQHGIEQEGPEQRVTAAQNIVVVQSELGSAPAIARALDRIQHPLIVGTLAGGDTCLVITADRAGAAAVAGELGEIIG
jgi:arginine repressor